MAVFPRFLNPNSPLIPPPSGVQSNFENPSNGNVTVNGVVSSGLALTVVTVALYIYGKTKHKLHLDDLFALVAVSAFIACHVFVYRIMTTTGYFVRGWDLQIKDLEWHYFNLYFITTLYNVTMIFIKAAILLQWARIFTPGERNIFFWLCYSIASLNAIFYIVTILVDLLRCHPVQYHWDKAIPGGHCDNDDLLSPLSGGINVILDLTILLIPQKIIWKLNLPFKKKLGVSLVFVVGILCIIFATVRLSWAIKLLNAGDYAYDVSYEVLYGSLEMTFAFLTFSFPGIPKPFIAVMQHTKSSLERVAQSSWGTGTGLSRLFTSRGSSEASTYYTHADERGLVSVEKAVSGKTSSSGKQTLSGSVKSPSREAQDQVVRTTTFNMSEDNVSNNNTEARGILPQHRPWEPLPTKSETH
ncbi:hypothetical protein F4802DRAFT_580984 [Xylaria palmicola]|nr:hypothetical protein F4802DRAFT_580984 [Xylaria palmicola]